MYNMLIGGAAGDGIDTMSSIFEKILKKSGYHIFTIRDVMSRIRGGHNFSQTRFSDNEIMAHRDTLDCLFALNKESFELHKHNLRPGGFIICDMDLDINDSRVIKLNLIGTAKRLGNVKVYGVIGLGSILKLFGIDIAHAEEVLSDSLKSDLLAVNLAALREGFDMVEAQFKSEQPAALGHMVVSGNAMLALGALAADLKFYSAYPMSPSTSILEYLEAHGEALGVAVEQAEDEIAAVNMALGASYAGARAMVGTSGGGFCLMTEAFGFAGIAEIPIVIVDVQRPGPATGLPTRTEQSDLKFVISASQGEFPRLVIAVKNHTDAFYQAARAIELAEKYRIPVIILSDQYLADSSATIPVLDVRTVYKNTSVDMMNSGDSDKNYALTDSGISPRMIPGKSEHVVRIDSDEHDEYGVITESAQIRTQMMDKRMRKLKLLETELIEPDFRGDEDFEILLVGFGSTFGAISEAVSILNAENERKYGALMFGDVCPLPLKRLKQCAAQAKVIINIEQNATGQLASILREGALAACHSSILKYDGRQLSVDDILHGIKNIKH